MPARLTLKVSGDRQSNYRNNTSDDIVTDCYRKELAVIIDDQDCSVVLTLEGDSDLINKMKLKWGSKASIQSETTD
jgi:hypothetical protein